MLKRIIFLLLLAAATAFPQSNDDFAGTNAVINNNRQKWVTPTGTVAASNGSLEIVGDGTVTPYNSAGPINYGYNVWDSLMTGGNFEAFIVFNQKGATDNVRYFAIGVATGKDWTNAVGYFGGMQEMLTSGGVDRYNLKRMTGTMATLGGTNPSDFAATQYLSHEFAAGDTFGISVWADNRVTIWWRAAGGGSRDTLSTNAQQHNFSAGAYVWIGGADLATSFKATAFGIRAAGGAAPPPAASDVNPPDASFTLSQANPVKGTQVFLTVTATDDSALNQSIVEVDTLTGGYHTITTNSYAGTVTSGGFTSASFTRYVAGNANVRVRTSDRRGRLDTTAVQVVTFTNPPAVNNTKKKVFGWLTFTDTQWPAPYSGGGSIPVDSLPWEVLTHASLFAANGGNPPQASYVAQYPYLFARAHSSGVYAGICVGGSGDGNLVTLLNTPANWPSWIGTYMSYLDNGRGDFIDFDLEGTYTLANIASFFAQVKDSMNVAWRYSGNDPTRKPFIVLTVSASRARSWGPSLAQYCEMVVMMTYDYMQLGTWGRLVPDCQPKSRQFYNGTGTITDIFGTGTNAEAPTMQKFAGWAAEGGWAANQIVVGFDVMPGYYQRPTGSPSMYFRMPEPVTGATANGGAPTYSSLLSTINAIPTDSIFFDQVGQYYWARSGSTGQDRLYSFMALPGRDSALRATRKIVDSMNIGGAAFWNLGTEVWPTSNAIIPAGGKGWFFSQLRDVFRYNDTTAPKLAPPTLISPAVGATGVATNPTLDWSDVSGSTEFWVQVSTSQSFTSLTVSDSNFTISQRAISGLANNQQYWWRVATQNANGFGQFSTAISFTTIPAVPGVPALVAPGAGATNQPASLTLSWSAGTGATTHQLQVDSLDNTFTHLVVDQSGLTGTSQLVVLRNGKTYHWRVRATNAAGSSAYTASRSFSTVAGAPGPALLSTPANTAGNQDTNALPFVWGTGIGATNYRFKLSVNANLSSPFKDTLTSALGYTAWGLTGNTTYYWTVIAKGATDSTVTATWSFVTTAASSGTTQKKFGQWPMVIDQERDVVDFGQPPLWFGMKRGRSDGADVPTPSDTTWDAYSLAGKVQRIAGGGRQFTPWGTTSGGGSSSGAVENGDTATGLYLWSSTIRGPLAVRQPVSNDTTLTAGFDLAANTSRTGITHLTAPSRDGVLALTSGEDMANHTTTNEVPMDQPSGGFGTSPTITRTLGTYRFFWGYDNRDATPSWRPIFPSEFNAWGLPSSYGLPAGKFAVTDGNGGWTMFDTLGLKKDSVGAGGAGGSGFASFDPDSGVTIWEEFPRGGVNSTTTADGTVVQTTNIGTNPWNYSGFASSSAATTAITFTSSQRAGWIGGIMMDPSANAAGATYRGGVLALAGSVATYPIEFRQQGTYKFKFRTPATEDSVGWMVGLVEKRLDAGVPIDAYTNSTEAMVIAGGSIATAPDTIWGFTIGNSNITKTVLLTPYSADTDYKGMIVVGASDIKYYVNDGGTTAYVLRATISSNLPATGIFGAPTISVWNWGFDAVATGKDFEVEYWYFKPTGLTR